MAEETSENQTQETSNEERMLALKENICETCGGILRLAYIIEFECCTPKSMRLDAPHIASVPLRLCPGHPASDFQEAVSELERVESLYQEAVRLGQHLLAIDQHWNQADFQTLWEKANAANNETIRTLAELREQVNG